MHSWNDDTTNQGTSAWLTPENSKVGLSGFFLTLNPLQNHGNNDTFAAGRLNSGTFPSRF